MENKHQSDRNPPSDQQDALLLSLPTWTITC